MFKIGDKIMVRGYEEWGEGEIKEENHSIYGDLYVTYFSDKDVSLTSCSQNNFYQTLEQQITSNLTAYSIICDKIEKVITNKCNISFIGTGLTSDFRCVDEIDIEDFFKNHNNKGDKREMMKFNFGDKVKYVSRPDFGVGVVVSKMKDGWYLVVFSNFSITPNSVHVSDLLPCETRGCRAETTLFEEFSDMSTPKITNYNYNEDTAVTTIEWSDGTKTTVHAEHPDTADPYTGFVTACAKRAFGNNNTINNLFDEWAIKKPEREMIAKIEAENAKIEEQRIAEKRKAKKEKWLIRKRAMEIAKEYEAKKLAHEKYGVPIDYKAGDNN